MFRALSIQLYTWSSSRCKSLGVFQIAPLLDLSLSLVSCPHHSALVFAVVRLIFPLLAFWAFSASCLAVPFSEGFDRGKTPKLPR